jgi:hypothetical protein
MRKATMRDVSEATGFSMFTVSRALNGGDGVADDSRELILKVARELGYVPNRAAQALRRSSRDSVAVITAHASNSYYLNLMSGIQQMLQPSQWTVVLGDIAVNGTYDRAQEDRMINRLIESRMAGIISTVTLQPESLSLLAKWDIPVVFVDSPPAASTTFPASRPTIIRPACWWGTIWRSTAIKAGCSSSTRTAGPRVLNASAVFARPQSAAAQRLKLSKRRTTRSRLRTP